MNPVRLPRSAALCVVAGGWILSWDEQVIGSRNEERDAPQSGTRIGPALGSNALTETEARRLARGYLLSRLPPGILAQRSKITLVEFIEKRFMPEVVAGKKLAWRAHYHSILKHILSPEDCGRLLGSQKGHATETRVRDARWPYLGQLCLRDIQPLHVEKLIHAAVASGYAPQTVRQVRSLLSAVFSYAKQELVFTGANPTGAVKLPRIDRTSARALTVEQLEQVLGSMRYPEKQIAIFRLLTDMNVSETCGLQWKNVNLTGTWSAPGGKLIPPITISVRKRWYRGELADVMRTRQRDLPIPAMLLPMLLLLSARTRFHSPDDFVLTSRAGTAINISNLTARRLGALSTKLGIPLTLRALRHTIGLDNGGLVTQLQCSMRAPGSWDLL